MYCVQVCLFVMNISKVWLLYSVVCAMHRFTVAQDDSVGYDTGFLSSCNLQLLDLTISSDLTDNLKLLLNVGRLGEYHIYPMNRSSSLLLDPNFRKDYKTVMFIHGFTESTAQTLLDNVVSAYLKVGGHNIILLDANPFTWVSYLRAARASLNIGNRLGLVITNLSRRGLNISNFTLIGHSLGAHVAGITGKTFRKRSGKRLPFIVGLDPAGPCFRDVPRRQRIAASDADFVEVIHTNGVGLGLMNAVGKVDFYFNGGRFQINYPGEKCGAVCSHLRAVSIWCAAVVNNYKFLGIRCNSLYELDNGYCFGSGRNVSFLGPATLRNTTGIFLVNYRRVLSYCLPYNSYYLTEVKKWFGHDYNFL